MYPLLFLQSFSLTTIFKIRTKMFNYILFTTIVSYRLSLDFQDYIQGTITLVNQLVKTVKVRVRGILTTKLTSFSSNSVL